MAGGGGPSAGDGEHRVERGRGEVPDREHILSLLCILTPYIYVPFHVITRLTCAAIVNTMVNHR